MKRILSILLILAFATPATAQLQPDSLWGFKQLRHFTDRNQKVIAGSLLAVVIVAQGANNSHFYNKNSDDPFFIDDLHAIQDIQTWGVAALGYTAGLDPIQTWGAGSIAIVGFKGMINIGKGAPFIDPNENPSYRSMKWERDLWFYGNRRYLQLGLGAVALFHKPIYRGVRHVVRRVF